jgi:putative spermidine/putrescine transport system substrate-binding protein
MRRKFLRGAAVMAVLAVAVFGVSACGSDNNDNSGGAKGPDINAQGEGKLNIVDWEGYTDPSFTKGFEKQTGCKINDTFAGTSDEMFTKFRSGGGGQYDLASFSGDASLRAIKSGSVAVLDTSKLTNFKDLAPQLQSPDFNTQNGKHYGESFTWGANVLIYNADKIKQNLDS